MTEKNKIVTLSAKLANNKTLTFSKIKDNLDAEQYYKTIMALVSFQTEVPVQRFKKTKVELSN